jgi:hypothetical protein
MADPADKTADFVVVQAVNAILRVALPHIK